MGATQPQKIKILVDARMLGPRGHGIARYVRAIARAQDLWRANPSEYSGAERLELVFATDARFPQPDLPQVSCTAPFLSLREWWELPRLIRKVGAHFYHSTSFASLPICPVPWIQTLHDLNHLRFGNFFERFYYEGLVASFARRAKGLWTVSKFSRDEISQFLGLPRERIEVLYNAVEPALHSDAALLASALQGLGVVPGHYLLCLGNPKPHKNQAMLVGAFLAADVPNLKLVLSSSRPRGGHPHNDRIIYAGDLSEAQVAALLSGCRALCSPSLYEGFGLPPVEAALLGKEVLVSDIPPHREGLARAKGGVTFLSPVSPGGWMQEIRRIARDAPRPVTLGAESFSQAMFARRILELYLKSVSLSLGE